MTSIDPDLLDRSHVTRTLRVTHAALDDRDKMIVQGRLVSVMHRTQSRPIVTLKVLGQEVTIVLEGLDVELVD